MHLDLLEILRCPYCGGHLELVTSLFHRSDKYTVTDGVLGCQCCVFPVVDGIRDNTHCLFWLPLTPK